MKVNAYVCLKDPETGEIEGHITSQGESAVVTSSRVVAIDYAAHQHLLNQDLPELYQFRNGQFVKRPPKPEAVKTYAELRIAEYPRIEDQLDAQWKGGSAAEEMRQRILAIKDKHPKPA